MDLAMITLAASRHERHLDPAGLMRLGGAISAFWRTTIGGAGAVMTSHSRYNNVEITDVARYFTIVGKLCGKAISSERTWLTQ